MTTSSTPAAPADDFDAVFDAITKLDDKGQEPEVAPAPVAAAKTPEEIAAEEKAAAEAAKVEPTAEEKAAAEAAKAEPTAEEKSAARIAELEAALEVAKKPAAEPAAVVADPPAATEPAAPKWYTPPVEEAEVIAAYEKEWPEISAAEKLRTKASVYNAVQYVFAEIAKAYGPTLDRFKVTADAIEEHMTLQELRGAHNDYDTVRDKVVAWADALPLAFRAGAQATLKSGTPEEVNSLIAEYKKQNPAAAVAAPAAAPVKTELSPAAKKAAGKLTVVDSKRTTQATVADPNDFDAAWDEPDAAKG